MTAQSQDIIAAHGLTADEYADIVGHLGRDPNLLELGIFSVMWSEHCSYKSSRRHLAKLPTKGPQVIHGPGENAGVVDIGDGQAVVFKMESHNHPSFIEPYQGAATGVGGIMRDVFTMGARPIAMMNALRFGAFDHPLTHHLVPGVVAGIGGYGNCMGVPTVGGETNFHPAYNGNILVNAMCVGLVDQDKIFLSAAKGAGNPVVYVGAKTGRDGIHGATMASAEFSEDSEEKRPTVQVGDPFTEKLLLEACLELMATDAILAIQDMGAAGLTSSSVEMAAKGAAAGEGGFDLDLDRVPQREADMTAYEMMLSESQERMLMVLRPGHEDSAAAIFEKWGVDFAVIGETTATGRLVIRHGGEVVADLPLGPLADAAPNYDRPYTPPPSPPALTDLTVTVVEGKAVLRQKEQDLGPIIEALIAETVGEDAPTHLRVGLTQAGRTAQLYIRGEGDPAAEIVDRLLAAAANLGTTDIVESVETESAKTAVSLADNAAGSSLVSVLGQLMACPDLCSRAWIWSQYDHSVMGDTVVPPGSDAAVIRIHGKEKALAITTDVTPRYCLADAKEGGKQAVAESYRNLVATGALPLAITNCLNFGNPERPDIMAQFVGCIEGMAEAAEALAMPVVSGNVSLYNETSGQAILPTPAIGAVGLVGKVDSVTRLNGAREGDAVIALGLTRGWLGQSLYLREIFGIEDGAPPPVDLKAEREVGDLVLKLMSETEITAAHDVADGGLLVAIAEMALASGQGVALTTPVKDRRAGFWFGEDQARYVLALPTEAADRVVLKCAMAGIQATRLGLFGGEDIIVDGRDRMSVFDLDRLHSETLPQRFETEESPMPMAKDELTTMIKEALPDAEIELTALAGDDDHWQARIISSAFDGLNRVQQHQLVYRALKGKMGGTLHALALETVPLSKA
ncbi:phosphoribosylformylglycinamidine synthase II [Parvularcula bermudensis HTCC2503]|uniref:Phosphoribosylformylglycinamidine synthase subunit PurL n=1 Tax=Parvularcula bermudensis (strain ATCC BAA-594 / HTCC2503 / KCTC 12087) TaxID=314260 RepID=E0TCS8_PARBH|nr:phosphoribosylformylglycinamidine synthase subunit PurL [Parvularcula bermudensis]ADM09867.1 phosphoribosylformylglycinamidine synthase II [Parvularcula bermudensis HTCC2503]